MSYLQEGLMWNDLEDLVKTDISIDEYESKISDDAVVIGFSVKTSEAAEDLVDFFDKAGPHILDVESSPGQTPDGDFIVFVELLRDDNFPVQAIELIKSLKGITGHDLSDFEFTSGKNNPKAVVNRKNIKQYIKLDQDVSEDSYPIRLSECMNFFHNSQIENLQLKRNLLILESGHHFEKLHVLAHGSCESVSEIMQLHRRPFSMDPDTLRECSQFKSLLGHNWDVSKIDKHFIFSNNSSDNILVVKKITN